jgi:uncharacterized protein (TIGR02246 family)
MRRPILAAIAVSLVLTSPLILCGLLVADDKAEAPLREMLDAYVAAFNKGDSAAVGEHWRADGVYIDRATGEKTKGREAIVASLSDTFSRPEKLRLQLRVSEIRFITPEVAQLEGVATMSAADVDPFVTNVSAIALKSEGDKAAWQLSSVEEIPPATPESAEEALMPLAWMVGLWTDHHEAADAKPVRSSFRWSANNTFLIRSFVGTNNADEEAEGTQVIGWDPIAKHIRSWTFFSDGGFSEAVWTKVGDEWSIKSVQTLADGRLATGTFVIERVDHDTMKVQLVAHEVDGESLPAKPAITVVRQKETTEKAPQGDAAPKSPTPPTPPKTKSK